MTPRRPDLDDLSVLALIAETGGIGRAALQLGVSQPSISRRMRTLERALGVRVLNRGPTGTSLTPTGRVVVDWASALLASAEDFTRSVEALRDERAGTVRAAVSMTIAEHYAPTWLARLRAVDPGTAVSLTVCNSADVAALVDSGKAEVGFLESPTVRRTLRRRRIGWDFLAVAVHADHEWAKRRRPISVEELALARLLVREPGSGTRETIEGALATKGLTLAVCLEMASNTALKSAALAGMGPVVLSELALGPELLAEQLARVEVSDLQLRRPLNAVWRRDEPPSPGVIALVRAALDGSERVPPVGDTRPPH
jgi:DNA-binding transcriptional LysR family regulator